MYSKELKDRAAQYLESINECKVIDLKREALNGLGYLIYKRGLSSYEVFNTYLRGAGCKGCLWYDDNVSLYLSWLNNDIQTKYSIELLKKRQPGLFYKYDADFIDLLTTVIYEA